MHAYLESLVRFGMRPGLERIRALLSALGEPQARLRAIHVVGTNGKSSTTAFAAAALHSAGLRTGAYLSPHVHGWEERVQIDGRPVTEDALEAALERVRLVAPEVEREAGEGPTHFEALTGAAFLLLAEAGVEVAVVEAGLGGRFDATNVLDATLVGLTTVGLDHADVLGETREEILSEKLGVLGHGALLICGPLDDELFERAALLAGARGARGARRIGAEEIAAERGTLPGRFLQANAALALELAEAWLAPQPLDRAAARAALRAAVPPGRLELEAGSPPILRDGAHNADGMRALAAELDGALGSRRPRVAVLGLQADKAAAEMAAALLPHVDAVVATASGRPGCLSAAEVASHAPGAEVVDDPAAALERAVALAGPGGAVLVTGSIYLLGALSAARSGAGAR